MVVRNRRDMELYLNGVRLNSSYSGSGGSMQSVGQCVIGYDANATNFHGKILNIEPSISRRKMKNT